MNRPALEVDIAPLEREDLLLQPVALGEAGDIIDWLGQVLGDFRERAGLRSLRRC